MRFTVSGETKLPQTRSHRVKLHQAYRIAAEVQTISDHTTVLVYTQPAYLVLLKIRMLGYSIRVMVSLLKELQYFTLRYRYCSTEVSC